MRINKSLAIQSFIGWAFANFVMHMSDVAHQPIHSVWDIILILFITWGAMAIVFSISELCKLNKEAKESQAKYHEAMIRIIGIILSIIAIVLFSFGCVSGTDSIEIAINCMLIGINGMLIGINVATWRA